MSFGAPPVKFLHDPIIHTSSTPSSPDAIVAHDVWLPVAMVPTAMSLWRRDVSCLRQRSEPWGVPQHENCKQLCDIICPEIYMMTSSNGNIFRVTGPLCGEFTGYQWISSQRPLARSFDVFFNLHLNNQSSKQSWDSLFEMLACSLWRHCNDQTLNGSKSQHNCTHFQINIITWKILHLNLNFT